MKSPTPLLKYPPVPQRFSVPIQSPIGELKSLKAVPFWFIGGLFYLKVEPFSISSGAFCPNGAPFLTKGEASWPNHGALNHPAEAFSLNGYGLKRLGDMLSETGVFQNCRSCCFAPMGLVFLTWISF